MKMVTVIYVKMLEPLLSRVAEHQQLKLSKR